MDSGGRRFGIDAGDDVQAIAELERLARVHRAKPHEIQDGVRVACLVERREGEDGDEQSAVAVQGKIVPWWAGTRRHLSLPALF